ncbi:hypothetical protein F5Y19DRAFT_62410 [Xylariaceae sp. FL1651]|nr:hypothetical protein F5Y19DRAFT_62410 [Xylariaceae sp. FL1651]
MAVIAVAGGTGNMGKTLVEALVASKKHDVKILARKPNLELEAQLGVSVIAVDYNDVEALKIALEKHNIHTVISAISMLPGPNGEKPMEVELIRASNASKTTKRMISSDWGIPHTEADIHKLASVPEKFTAQVELKQATNLETTYVVNGMFMDYWGLPAVKSHVAPITMAIDILNNKAAIPGDGESPVAFTHTTDVAKLVVAMLDLEKWEPQTYIIGDRITWNEFLQLAEDAKGTSFETTHDSVEMLKKGQVTELPGQIPAYAVFPKETFQGMAAAFGLWFAEGTLSYMPKKLLNNQFPEIKTMKVKEMLERAWKRV